MHAVKKHLFYVSVLKKNVKVAMEDEKARRQDKGGGRTG